MKHVVTLAPFRQTVLVTGFGAFPGAPANPTATLLRRLERHRGRLARLGVRLDCLLLPVVYDEIEARLATAVATHRPDAILHLGLASRRRYVSVETRASNRAGPLHPDAARRRPASQVLAAGAPGALAASWPAAAVTAALRRRGLDARRSIDAGDYVCNATLYASLRGAAAERIGFLHVPRVRRRQARMAARPTIEALTEAVLATILEMTRGRSAPRL